MPRFYMPFLYTFPTLGMTVFYQTCSCNTVPFFPFFKILCIHRICPFLWCPTSAIYLCERRPFSMMSLNKMPVFSDVSQPNADSPCYPRPLRYHALQKAHCFRGRPGPTSTVVLPSYQVDPSAPDHPPKSSFPPQTALQPAKPIALSAPGCPPARRSFPSKETLQPVVLSSQGDPPACRPSPSAWRPRPLNDSSQTQRFLLKNDTETPTLPHQ